MASTLDPASGDPDEDIDDFDFNSDDELINSPISDSSSGSKKSKSPKISKKPSPNKFKYIIVFNNFNSRLVLPEKTNKLIYDADNQEISNNNLVYGITVEHKVIPIKKITLIKQNNKFIFLVEDIEGFKNYQMSEISLFQGQKDAPVFNLSTNYNYEFYYNFKGDTLMIDDNTEYYLIVREKKAVNNVFQIIHIFYNFKIPKKKIKSFDFFVGNDNALSGSSISKNISSSTIINTGNISNTPTLQLKKGNDKAIQPFKDRDPYEVNGCILDNDGKKYKIEQMHIDNKIPLEENNIILKSILDNKVKIHQISELKDNYKHTRCGENDTGCMSFKFKDEMINAACSGKNPYKEFKIDNKILDDILASKNNSNCKKDAEILKRKCDMVINSKK